MIPKRKVLVLCTGNSTLSQMAEGLINHFLGEQWHAFSAGTRPTGYVHSLAILVMAELGVDLLGHHSKSTDEFRGQNFDQVITVCDNAFKDCPVWLGGGQRIHIGFDDPARPGSDETTQVADFRRIRDEIREQILTHLQQEGAKWQSSKVAK